MKEYYLAPGAKGIDALEVRDVKPRPIKSKEAYEYLQSAEHLGKIVIRLE